MTMNDGELVCGWAAGMKDLMPCKRRKGQKLIETPGGGICQGQNYSNKRAMIQAWR